MRRVGQRRAAAPGTRARRRGGAAIRLVTSSFSCRRGGEQLGERRAPPRRAARSCRGRAAAACRRGTPSRRSASEPAPLSLSPSVCAIVGSTSSGSAIGASATKNTPCGKSSTSSAAAWSASRVLPVPPGPVSVSSRTSSRRSSSATAASSRSRPISGVGWTGRFVGRFSSVRSAGNSFAQPVDHELREPLRPRQVLEPVLAEVAQLDAVGQLGLDQLAGRLREQHLPAVAGGADPRGARHVEADVAGRRRPTARRCGSRSGPRAASRRARAARARPPATAPVALGNATKNASPCVSTSRPPASANAARRRRRCSSSSAAYSRARAGRAARSSPRRR